MSDILYSAIAVLVSFFIGFIVCLLIKKKSPKKDILGTILIVHDTIDGGSHMVLEFADEATANKTMNDTIATFNIVHRNV